MADDETNEQPDIDPTTVVVATRVDGAAATLLLNYGAIGSGCHKASGFRFAPYVTEK